MFKKKINLNWGFFAKMTCCYKNPSHNLKHELAILLNRTKAQFYKFLA